MKNARVQIGTEILEGMREIKAFKAGKGDLRVREMSQRLGPVLSALHDHFADGLVAVVLFGSRARGDHKPASDWDLLVIAEQLPQKRFQRHLQIKRVLPPLWRSTVSVLAKTPAEFEAGVPDLFLDIALDGIILYDTNQYIATRLAWLRRLIHQQGLYRERQGEAWVWQWEKFPGPGWQLIQTDHDDVYWSTGW